MKAKDDKRGYSAFAITKRAFGITMRYEFAKMLGQDMLSILHGASWGALVFVLQAFYDSVANTAAGSGTIKGCLWALCGLTGVTILEQALNGLDNFVERMRWLRMDARCKELLAEKAGRVDPLVYEDPAMLDDINKAQAGASHIINLRMTVGNIFTFYLPFFLVVSVYLWLQRPLLVLSLAFVFVPTVLSQVISAGVFAKLEDVAAPVRRKYEYYEKTLTDREFFKETRVSGGFRFLGERFKSALTLFSGESWKAEAKTARLKAACDSILLLGYMGVLALLFQSLLGGYVTVGVFAAVFAQIGMLFSIMDEIVSRRMGYVSRNMGSVRNFLRFMDAKERGGESARLPEALSVDLKDVCFSYPGSGKNAVDGVTLSIKPGETLAVVGENGAGKTTLVRLMTGLYLPTGGKISLGGRDTAAISPDCAYRSASAVFQKFQKYRLTLSENVRVGDTESAEPIAPSLEKADLALDPETFPQGEETMLSREFDGVDLSGGQWQRVAIARGLYRAHSLIVLDEPAAAIDPLEETRVYRKFAALSKGKTAVIVTHRMGSARIANRIAVMDAGKIAELGTHEELMRKGGLYASMVAAQAGWYE